MSTDAGPSALAHASEELLEEYTFGRIREPQLSRLEEHLLICPKCQSELNDLEEYKVFMKAGLASFESERLSRVGRRNLQTRLVREVPALHLAWSRMPGAKSLLAAAVLLALASAAVTWRMQSSPVAMAPLATIRLIALRGGEGDVAHAPSGRPLDLVFNRRDLPAGVSYRAEIINSSGRRMWRGNVRIADQDLSMRVTGPLRAGAYWVRLYTSAGQLLREFGLSVE